MGCAEVEFVGYPGMTCEGAARAAEQAEGLWRASLDRLIATFPVCVERISDVDEATMQRIVEFAEATYLDIINDIPDARPLFRFVADVLVYQFDDCARALTGNPASLYYKTSRATLQALLIERLAVCYPGAAAVGEGLTRVVSEAGGAEAHALSVLKAAPQASPEAAEAVRVGVFRLREQVGSLATLASALTQVNAQRLAAAGLKRSAGGVGFVSDMRIPPARGVDMPMEPYVSRKAAEGAVAPIGGLLYTGALIYIAWFCEARCARRPLAELNLAAAHVSRELASQRGLPVADAEAAIRAQEALLSSDELCERVPPVRDCERLYGGGAYITFVGISAVTVGLVWSLKKMLGK
jgi:hypothetical protein